MIETTATVDVQNPSSALDVLRREVLVALSGHIEDSGQEIRQSIVDRLSTRTGIPASAFEKVRVKTSVSANGNTDIWVGIDPIRAASIGTPYQIGHGARVGRFYFEGGFVPKMRSGYIGIFRRLGKPQYPIEEQVIDIAQALGTVDFIVDKESADIEKALSSAIQGLIG